MARPKSAFRATPNAVHRLQKTLQKLALNDGDMEAEEVWHEEDTDSDLVLMQADKAGDRDDSIAIGNSRLKRLEELLDAVDCLKSSLERRISDFRQRKLTRSLMDLPDELLVRIFEMTEPSLSKLMGWSLVCRRVRLITISIPSLWERQIISTSMPSAVIDLLISRSRKHDHCLSVKSPLVPNDAISKHCHMWSSLFFDKLNASDLQLFQYIAPSSKLTSLHTISCSAAPYDPYDSYPNLKVVDYEFNNDWRPPNLKYLRCSYAMPKGLAVSTLRHCFFRFDRAIDIGGLAALLAANPLLETLGIILRDMDELDMDAHEQIEHRALQSFSFTSYGADEDVVREFLQATSFPNVATLSIDIARATSSFWQVLPVIGYNFAGIKNFDLKVGVEDVDDDGDFCYMLHMDDMFSHLPRSIESFSLAAFDMILLAHSDTYRVGTYGTFSELRSIQFNGCNCLDDHFFEELADRFMKEKIRLDALVVQNCQLAYTNVDIKEDEVKMLFQGAGVLQA